ncbi:unnamed protein product [Pleuronectes platessa]|uniref:Uncharacterized protein n=1 Tax=Pleuronectes platessa TaxID=8262 RepID=A0A9N7Z638_PLEPL|nr:unnamed protein product [Pleuronectes platessa]
MSGKRKVEGGVIDGNVAGYNDGGGVEGIKGEGGNCHGLGLWQWGMCRGGPRRKRRERSRTGAGGGGTPGTSVVQTDTGATWGAGSKRCTRMPQGGPPALALPRAQRTVGWLRKAVEHSNGGAWGHRRHAGRADPGAPGPAHKAHASKERT